MAKAYHSKVEVLCFPCNQFLKQEPGDAETIEVCIRPRYELGAGVTFMEKVDVNGAATHPVYRWLRLNGSDGGGPLGWNFCTFMVSSDGSRVVRFKVRPRVQAWTTSLIIETLRTFSLTRRASYRRVDRRAPSRKSWRRRLPRAISLLPALSSSASCNPLSRMLVLFSVTWLVAITS